MAQEGWKKESGNETGFHTPEAPILCANNCGFFGSSMTNNLCSKCYRDAITKQAVLAMPAPEKPSKAEQPKAAALAEPSESDTTAAAVAAAGSSSGNQQGEPQKPMANRCLTCRKKVGLTGFLCRCGGTYCGTHRYSDAHKCSFDYKGVGREILAKQNPVVMADKVDKI